VKSVTKEPRKLVRICRLLPTPK